MGSRLYAALTFIVRAIGLVGVIGVSAVLFVTFLTANKPSGMGAFCCAWAIVSAVLSWPRVPDAWRSDPPTQRQLEYAQALGIVVPAGISKGQLSDLISNATGR